MRAPRILTIAAACLFLLLAGGALAGCGGAAPAKQAEAPSGGHTGEEPEAAEAKKLEAEEKAREAAQEAETKKLDAGNSAATGSTAAGGSSKHRSHGSKHGSHKTHAAAPQAEAKTRISPSSEQPAPKSSRSSRAEVVGYHAELPASAPTSITPVTGGGATSGVSVHGKTKQPKQPKGSGKTGKEHHHA